MTLLAPSRLWLLLLVGALAVAYVVALRQRRQRAVRHPDVGLVRSVSSRRPGWRRHLTASALLLSVVALVAGLARPAYSAEVPRSEAVVVLAIDTSGSMGATDVAPTRLQAAVKAAGHFIDNAPDGYKIGLVTFDRSGHTLATPTTDHDALRADLQTLKPTVGTAAGEGLATALGLIQATTGTSAGAAGTSTTTSTTPSTAPGTGGTAPDAARKGDRPYAAVVLITDGASTVGRPLGDASTQAHDAGVPVYTIAFGTDTGTVTINGRTQKVPADPAAMAAVAEATGGTTYTATTAGQLTDVYGQIGTHIATETRHVELTVPLATVAALLLALGFVGTMVWSPRLV